MVTTPKVTVGRIYDPPAAQGGARVLVDRVWPRGLRKSEAHLDEWCKTIAPSTELRNWYGHDPDRYEEFARRYEEELKEAKHAEALKHLRAVGRQGGLTLLTATKAVDISHANVLAALLRKAQ